MSLLKEKIGYGFGDMSSSMFWKIFSYYLPIFYSNIFGLSLVDAGILVLVTRIWDAVSDPMMGVCADRTHTRWGKYRPYLLWVAAPFSICGILLFTTPDFSYGGKLVWAYVTYVMMMTVYTGINVPYGAMLGVITPDSTEKTVFSSFRMFFAYGGSFIALFSWEPLCRFFEHNFGASVATSWQLGMSVIAAGCFVLFLCCFAMTRERVATVSTVSIGKDFRSLLSNRPWWLLIGAALCFNLFNTVRGASVAYFFADVIGADARLDFGHWGNVLFYSGLFLGVGEIANMVGVALTVSIAGRFGKKTTFIGVNVALIVLSVIFLHGAAFCRRILDDDGASSSDMYMHGHHVAIGVVDVCRCERLCRTQIQHCLDWPYLLVVVDGAEIWRCHWRCGRAVASRYLRLHHPGSRRPGRGECGSAGLGHRLPLVAHVVHPRRCGGPGRVHGKFLSPYYGKVNEICSRLGVRRAAANAEEAREQSTLQPE